MKLRPLIARKALPFLALTCFSASAQAVVFDQITTATDFQDALTEAAGNGVDDTIVLPAGTFVATAPFVYAQIAPTTESLTIQGAGADATFLDGNDTVGVLQLIQGSSGPLRITDLSIQHGNFNLGGGLFIITATADVSLEGVNLLDNNSSNAGGGGLIQTTQGGDISLTACRIQGNEAVNTAGGLALQTQDGNISVQNSRIEGNKTSTLAGGLFIQGTGSSPITFTDNVIFDNHSTAGSLGGVFISTPETIHLSGNRFEDNTAVDILGALGVQNFSEVALDRNIFFKNSAAAIGGFSISTDHLTLTNNLIDQNEATTQSFGAGATSSNELVFANNIVTRNQAATQIGGLSVSANTALFTNNTFAGNQSGLEAAALTVASATSTQLYNNLFYRNLTVGFPNDVRIFDNDSDTGVPLTLANNLYRVLHSDCEETPACQPNAQVTRSANIIGEDPLLADLSAGDVHLGAGSPAIDAGDLDAPNLLPLDFDGNPRPFNGIPDIGALEAVSKLTVQPSAVDFGDVEVDHSASREITLRNEGNTSVTVSSIALTSDNDYSIDANAGSNPCGSDDQTLQAGEECTVLATFSPDDEGVQDNQVQINSNDVGNPNLVVSLTGNGVSDANPLNGGGCALTDTTVAANGAWMWLLSFASLGFVRSRKR